MSSEAYHLLVRLEQSHAFEDGNELLAYRGLSLFEALFLSLNVLEIGSKQPLELLLILCLDCFLVFFLELHEDAFEADSSWVNVFFIFVFAVHIHECKSSIYVVICHELVDLLRQGLKKLLFLGNDGLNFVRKRGHREELDVFIHQLAEVLPEL